MLHNTLTEIVYQLYCLSLLVAIAQLAAQLLVGSFFQSLPPLSSLQQIAEKLVALQSKPAAVFARVTGFWFMVPQVAMIARL